MAFFRSYIAPLLIVLIFMVAMLAVSARFFIPNDMLAPAPLDNVEQAVGAESLTFGSLENDPHE